jgi:hypothetical protein
LACIAICTKAAVVNILNKQLKLFDPGAFLGCYMPLAENLTSAALI